MKITCLMENTVGNPECESEHGLSLYIETKNNTILADTGASDLFLRNAEVLEIDLSKVEAVFLSHGHYDHGGGILSFAKKYPATEIVMQRKAFGDFWHKSDSTERYIGIDESMKQLENLHLLEGNFSYNEHIDIFTCGRRAKLLFWPRGNLILKEKIGGEFKQDEFLHEQYLVLEENGSRVLISGCAHNGILNILEVFCEKYQGVPDVIVSGFHMKKKEDYTQEDITIMKETAKQLKEKGIMCYTGHCTGEEPYRIMKEIMGEQLQYLHCGDRIEI